MPLPNASTAADAVGVRPDKIVASRVLVPLDGSAFAERAVPVAHRIAQRLGVPVELIAVTDTAAGAELARADLAAIASAELVDGTHVVIGRDSAAELTTLTVALRPAVLCLATHGRGRSEAVLGSVADSLISSSAVPVLALGPCRARQPPGGNRPGRRLPRRWGDGVRRRRPGGPLGGHTRSSAGVAHRGRAGS